MKNMVKILDCTLRDGGYFTNWDFEISFVKDVISSLNYSNVDIIELGYKSPKKQNLHKFLGRFKYCNNSLFDFIPKKIGSAEYACMIDAADFIQSIDSLIKDKSLFDHIGENAAFFIRENFDNLAIAKKLAAFYQSNLT